MILIDRQIQALCKGIVPDQMRFYFESTLWTEIPKEIKPLVDPYDPDLVNPASLDIRIGDTAKLRTPYSDTSYVDVDLPAADEKYPFMLYPGDRLLVASLETINLPSFLTAQFKLKSSRAREWYGHQFAGFCDPGWNGSKLTMELVNNDLAPLPIYPGLKIGQLIFSLTLGIPDKTYAETGRYNNDSQVHQSKG